MKYLIKAIIILLSTTLLAFGANKKIIVDITKQEAFAYEDGKLVMKGWVSTGRAKYKTPKGRYRVLAKEKFHISNEWPKPDGGAEMPYMLRLTWSGVAIHLGYVPNRPASHGCIRAREGFAQELFKWADIGTRVIIKGKQPKWVSRKHRSPFYLTKYFYKKYNTNYKKERKYLAKLSKELQKLSKAHQQKMALKKAKKVKKYAKRKVKSRKAKLVAYYSKFSYKRLNQILRANYHKKVAILASTKLSRATKIKALKRISWVVKIIKQAKSAKRHHKYAKAIKGKRVAYFSRVGLY